MKGLALGLIMGILVGAVAVLAVQSLATSPVHSSARSTAQGQADMEITLHKEYLTRMIAQELEQANLPFTLQTLSVEPRGADQLAVTGQIEMSPFRIPATIWVQPTAVNGQLKMNITRTDFGSIPVPIDLDSRLGDTLNSEIASIQSSIPYRITSVRVSDQGLVLLGQEKK